MKFPENVLKGLNVVKDGEVKPFIAAEPDAKQEPTVIQDNAAQDAGDLEMVEPVMEAFAEVEDFEGEQEALLDSFNLAEIRRRWKKLPLWEQRHIINRIRLPVALPRFRSRHSPEMVKAYDEVFEYVDRANCVELFSDMIDVRMVAVERKKFNDALSDVAHRKSKR